MAGNSKDSKILAYKDMINQLNKTISTQTYIHTKNTIINARLPYIKARFF